MDALTLRSWDIFDFACQVRTVMAAAGIKNSHEPASELHAVQQLLCKGCHFIAA